MWARADGGSAEGCCACAAEKLKNLQEIRIAAAMEPARWDLGSGIEHI